MPCTNLKSLEGSTSAVLKVYERLCSAAYISDCRAQLMALAVTVAVAGMMMKTQRELRLVELLLLRRSTAARETLLLRKRFISWAHRGDSQ